MAFVIVANHPHKEDRIYVHLALWRVKIRTMSRSIVDRVWFLRWFTPLTGAFSVPKGIDAAIEVAIERIKRGHSVLMFAQGRTTRDRSVSTRRGALELALRSYSQILPIYISGRFRVKIGKPYWPKVGEDVMQKVWELADR